MAPALGDGDLLRVEAAERARPGDVVVARRAGVLVAHRLIRLDGAMAVTQGDACPAPDAPVPTDALLGRVVAVRRRPWRRFLARVRARVFR
jgi:hypothetical protein